MRLKLNRTLRAALIAAFTTVGFTLTQAQAFEDAVWTFENKLSADTNITGLTYTWQGSGPATYVDSGMDKDTQVGNYWLDADLGMALTMTDGQYVKLGINAYWANGAGKLGVGNKAPSSYTLMTWVNMSSIPNETYFFGTGDENTAGLGFLLNGGKIDLLAKTVAHHNINGSYTLSTGTWYNLAVTYDKDAGTAVAYVNGDQVGTLTGLGSAGFADPGGQCSYIGAASTNAAQDTFAGQMAEFKILSGALTHEEILAAAHLTSTAPTPVEALAWNGTAASSVWDTHTQNWVKNAEPAAFATGDNVSFGSQAESHTVTLGASITAGSVAVDAAAYELALNGNTLTSTKLSISGEGASLKLSGTGTVNAGSIAAADKTITIGSGAVLTGAGSATLAGTGTYALASGTKSLGSVSLGSDWTGYVRLSGVSFSNDNLDNLARNGASGVEMNGITGGYAANWNGGTVHAKIRLTNPSGTNDNIAWKWSDGTTSESDNYPTITFDGAWVGDGTFRLTEKRQCVTYSGDISGWTGAFEYRGSHGTKLTFAGNATTVNAAILNNGTNDASNAWKQFHLIVQNQATFNKAVGAYTLEIAASQSATFNGATNIANGVTMGDGATITVGGTGTLTLGGTVTFGGNAIVNNGTVAFGNNLVFNLDGLDDEEEAGVHTYTLFSGTNTADLSTLGLSNISLAGGTIGKAWTFGDNGTISWTLPSELAWDNGEGTGKWNSTDANWTGHPFVDGANAQFFMDAEASITEPVHATSVVVGIDETAVTVTISAEGAGTLTTPTLEVDNGTLTTNVTVEGLETNTVAAGSAWHIGADQTIAAGAIEGSVVVDRDKTVTLEQAATSKDLLLGITGEGNITLGTSVSFDSADEAAAASTKATGTLTLKEGVKLTVGNDKDKTASIASFNHVVMEQGAGIETKSRLVEINNLTVNTDASHTDVIKMLDTYNKDEVALNLKGTTTLDGNLEINSGWKYKVNIETLAGTGTLYLKGGSNEQHTATIGGGTVGGLELSSSVNLTVAGATALGNVSLGDSAVLNINQGVAATASSLSIRDNNKATLHINGSLDVSGNFYAIGCGNTTDITGSGESSSLTVGSLDICNVGTNFNLQNITMTVRGNANAGDNHNKNNTHIDLNAGSALNLLGEVTFNTNDTKYCTLNVNGGALTAGTDEEAEVTRTFQDIVAGADGGTVNFLNGANTVATLNMAAGDLAVTVGEHATLTIENATLKSTITGAVTFTGTVDITNHVISDRSDAYTGGETPGDVNGFRSTTGKMVMATGTVTDEGATYMLGGTDVTGDVVDGVYNVSTGTDYTHFYINAGTETLSHAIAGAAAQEQTLSGVVMSGGTLVADGESVSLEIADGAAVTVNATAATTISSLSGTGATLNITGDSVVTLAANSALTSTIDISGTATVKVNANEALGNAANSITVHTGATLDVNGKDAPANKLYTLTLDGGTLANTGSELSWGSRQLVKALVVTDDSKVNAQSNHFGLINGGYAATTIDLGATLEKVGSKNFYIVHSTITGDGAFKVTEGGLFFDFSVEASNRGTLATDIVMNGGTVGGTIVLADDISVTAGADGSTFSAAVNNAGHTITFDGASNLTVGGIISGEGGIVKDGAGTLTLNGTQTYTGTTVVKGGRLVVNGSLADDNSISVEGDATIGGNVDTTLVGIASTKTATFEEGIVTESGAIFSEGVQVTNNAGVTAKYGIDNANMAVTADSLMVADESEVVVRNEVQLDDVTVGTFGSLTLDNVPEAQLELETMTIGAGAFVSVYTSDEHTTEATVVISDTLTAGGGTLLANLTLKDDSTLDLSIDGYVVALTLGSTLTVAPEGGLVSLDADTIAALEALDVNESLDLVSAAFQTELSYGGNYNDLWFGQLFERVPGVEGDYRVYANGTGFGLTKVSNTPEPTTGTLSMLALMALAARRRRK